MWTNETIVGWLNTKKVTLNFIESYTVYKFPEHFPKRILFVCSICPAYHWLYSLVPQGQGVCVRRPLGLNAPMASWAPMDS